MASAHPQDIGSCISFTIRGGTCCVAAHTKHHNTERTLYNSYSAHTSWSTMARFAVLFQNFSAVPGQLVELQDSRWA
jgi:hypothetical protein